MRAHWKYEHVMSWMTKKRFVSILKTFGSLTKVSYFWPSSIMLLQKKYVTSNSCSSVVHVFLSKCVTLTKKLCKCNTPSLKTHFKILVKCGTPNSAQTYNT